MLDSQAKISRFLLVAFIAGVGLASFFYLEYFYLYSGIFVLTALAIIFRSDRDRRYWLIGGLVLLFGIWRYQISLPFFDRETVGFYNDQKVVFVGLVQTEPDQRIDSLKLTIKTEKLVQPAAGKITGKVLVKTSLYPQYNYGDRLQVQCRLQTPEPIEDFAYDRYLAKENIYSVCYSPKIKLLERSRGNILLNLIYGQKNYWQTLINKNLPEPQASLFAAVILGLRRGIPQELNDKFNVTGTTHLIAISGFNISILVTVLMEVALAFYLPRKNAFWLVSAVLVWYIVIIGFPASAVRAAIMGWLAILARHVGRLNKLDRAVISAGAVMILTNPKILRDDASFQLSFLAILGLGYFMPSLQSLTKNWPEKFGLKESLQTTLAAQLATCPLIILNYGRFSLIAPLVNLVVVPVAVYLTIWGTATIILAGLVPALGPLFFLPNYLLLTFLIKTVEFFSAWPAASLSL